ncbi:MAG: VWA domain-containing protein [Treponema sp.]|jgi:Ca-activated chloride channel family protein|nr:VWA domain-containing protein [Treponema sp.]
MTFDAPIVLAGFIFLIPFVVLEAIHCHRRGKILYLLNILQKEHKTRFVLSTVFFTLFLCCVIIALAGPRWGARSVVEYKRGVDVVFAFDVSRSMEIADIEPSRLGKAVSVARETVALVGNARVGAAFGKGRGVLALPLTWDINAVLIFLDSILTGVQTGTGTNLESLIDASSGAFLSSLPAKRLIALFSDGESLSGSLQVAVDRARNEGVSVVALGFGTEKGGVVPQRITLDRETGEPAVEREVIVSVRDTEALRNAAERSGGVFIDGNAPDAARTLANYIKSLAPDTGVSSYKREAAPRHQIFILAALVFLLLSKLAEKKIRRSMPRS